MEKRTPAELSFIKTFLSVNRVIYSNPSRSRLSTQFRIKLPSQFRAVLVVDHERGGRQALFSPSCAPWQILEYGSPLRWETNGPRPLRGHGRARRLLYSARDKNKPACKSGSAPDPSACRGRSRGCLRVFFVFALLNRSLPAPPGFPRRLCSRLPQRALWEVPSDCAHGSTRFR